MQCKHVVNPATPILVRIKNNESAPLWGCASFSSKSINFHWKNKQKACTWLWNHLLGFEGARKSRKCKSYGLCVQGVSPVVLRTSYQKYNLLCHLHFFWMTWNRTRPRLLQTRPSRQWLVKLSRRGSRITASHSLHPTPFHFNPLHSLTHSTPIHSPPFHSTHSLTHWPIYLLIHSLNHWHKWSTESVSKSVDKSVNKYVSKQAGE